MHNGIRARRAGGAGASACGHCLIVAAHPDDEVVGLGGQLPGFRDPCIVHVTDGAPRDMRDARAHGFTTRDQYARARRAELLAALELAGIPENRTRPLGFADQEASRAMPEIAARLRDLLAELHPEIVYTHPYEGGHPDHDATAFAVHAACRMLPHPPAIYEFTSYHARGSGLAAYEFLPYAECEETMVTLSFDDQARKRRMLDCFVTQFETLRPFYGGIERRRPAPRYDFTAPPHAGTLYYDRFSWGVRSGEWLALAREALDALGCGAARKAGG